MVPHPPGNLQRGFLLVPRIVQNRHSGIQYRSIRCVADRRISRNIQQNLALDDYSAKLPYILPENQAVMPAIYY